MKISTEKECRKAQKKRGGYIFLTTITIMIILFSNLLINYITVYRRGQRVENFIATKGLENEKENFETIVFHEIKKIEKNIQSGKYRSGAEYVGKTENGEKIWFSKEKNSQNGYRIVSLRSNGKNRFYVHSPESPKNLKSVIQRELYSLSQEINYIGVELEKEVVSKNLVGNSEKIYIKCQVNLVYENGNKQAGNPDKEVLKEFEVGIKN